MFSKLVIECPDWLFAGGLPEDYCGEEGRAELLHLTDDQRLHEEGGDCQPTPDGQGNGLPV